jgi:hypothetical protein
MENGGERAERHGAGSGAGGLGIIGAFAPWIIFGVIAGPSTWEWAVLAAAVAGSG